MTFRKTTMSKTKILMRIIALATLLQGGCSSVPVFKKKASFVKTEQQEKVPYLIMDDLSSSEKSFLDHFIKDYMEKSPSARKLLWELKNQKAHLEFFDKEVDKDNLFRAGSSDENTLSLNRKIREKGVSFDETFFHEAEHVAHLKKIHKFGINACSFSSLNDIYTYVVLLEALADRKAALCCMEHSPNRLSNQDILKKAEEVFEKRLLTKDKDPDERLSYEKDAIMLANSETNKLPNQIYFKQKPNWNKIVSLLSRGEVKKISILPQPTLTFLQVCLLREIMKNPNAEKLEDLEISCALTNKSNLQKNQKEVKEMISNLLIEVYGMCQKTKRSFPQKIRNDFLNLIGWPTAEQMNKIKKKEISFQEARTSNLEKFKTGELFDKAKKLLNSPEIRAFNIPEIQVFSKMLHFEKMILVPSKPFNEKRMESKVR